MSNSWENECNILLYIYDKTYSIHKLIIHYSKHKLERAKYAHPFGKKIFLFLGLGVSRGGNSFWIQNLRDEKTILKPEQITPPWKQCFFLALGSAAMHSSKRLVISLACNSFWSFSILQEASPNLKGFKLICGVYIRLSHYIPHISPCHACFFLFF